MRSSFIDFLGDTTPKDYNRREDIFNYGDLNGYPNEIKKLINLSVTAKSCRDLLASFIFGKGNEDNSFFLNNENDTINSLLGKVSVETGDIKGFSIHVGYNALGEKSSFKVIPFDWVRWGKEDVNGYKSKLRVSKDWSETRKNPIVIYDIYNPDNVLAQIERDGGIDKYNGQIRYVTFGSQEIYPKAFIDPVINDCIAEWKSGVFKKNLITKGFTKNTLIVTKPFEDKNERIAFRDSIKSQLGADGAGGITHYEADLESEDLSSEIFTNDIGSDLNDRLFEYTDKNVSDKICIAYMIPPSLIKNDDNSLFSSGTAIENMMLQVQMRTENIRNTIEEVFNDLFTRTISSGLNAMNFEIVPLITKTEEDAVTD